MKDGTTLLQEGRENINLLLQTVRFIESNRSERRLGRLWRVYIIGKVNYTGKPSSCDPESWMRGERTEYE